MENYRFAQCLGERFSPISNFFSLVSSRAFRVVPHSGFSCWYPNQCLPNLLKMLLLALPQIYTRVFHLWKSFDLDSAWVRDSRQYQLKVTVYLQGCPARKRCRACSLSCRYLNPYIKLKLMELAIKPHQEF